MSTNFNLPDEEWEESSGVTRNEGKDEGFAKELASIDSMIFLGVLQSTQLKLKTSQVHKPRPHY